MLLETPQERKERPLLTIQARRVRKQETAWTGTRGRMAWTARSYRCRAEIATLTHVGFLYLVILRLLADFILPQPLLFSLCAPFIPNTLFDCLLDAGRPHSLRFASSSSLRAFHSFHVAVVHSQLHRLISCLASESIPTSLSLHQSSVKTTFEFPPHFTHHKHALYYILRHGRAGYASHSPNLHRLQPDAEGLPQ
jgi:hypothetical protein